MLRVPGSECRVPSAECEWRIVIEDCLNLTATSMPCPSKPFGEGEFLFLFLFLVRDSLFQKGLPATGHRLTEM